MTTVEWFCVGYGAGLAGFMAGTQIWHWNWMRRWNREHEACCQRSRP